MYIIYTILKTFMRQTMVLSNVLMGQMSSPRNRSLGNRSLQKLKNQLRLKLVIWSTGSGKLYRRIARKVVFTEINHLKFIKKIKNYTKPKPTFGDTYYVNVSACYCTIAFCSFHFLSFFLCFFL